MKRRLRNRAERIAAADVDWWIMTYYRAACRIQQEAEKPTGLNIGRLWRKMQHMHDHIVAELAAEKSGRDRARLAGDLINRAITDYGLPESCRIDFGQAHENDDDPTPDRVA